MLKIFVIIFFSCTAGLTGLSQQYIANLNIDSLKKVLLVAKDTQRINTLNLLSTRILFGDQAKGYLEAADTLALEALTLSKNLNYKKGLGNALFNEGSININRHKNFAKILPSLLTALSLLKESGDAFYVAGCYDRIEECFHALGYNQTAIIYCDSAINLFQQLGDTVTSVWTMNSKGHSYFDLGNYDLAYKTFYKAQQLTEKKDTLLQVIVRFNLARLFLGADLPEIALDYGKQIRGFFPGQPNEQKKNMPWTLMTGLLMSGEAYLKLNQTDSAFRMAETLNLPLEEQGMLDNAFYGHLYYALQQYEKALIYFKYCYKEASNSSHEGALALSAAELANIYARLKNFPKAIYYANESIKLAKKISALFAEKIATGVLADVYRNKKDYKKAFEYDQLYKILGDSLAPEEYKRKLSLIQIQHDLEGQQQIAQLLSKENLLKQQTLKIQEQQLEQGSFLKKALIGGFCAFVLLAIVIFRNFMLKRKHEKEKFESQLELQQLEAEKTRIEFRQQAAELEMQALRAQMNPHFIFNCLSSINRYILINRTELASDYLTKFSRLIRMALHNSEKSLITLENELETLKLYLDLERLRFKDVFSYSITFINTIDVSAVFIPPLLIQPFAENAIWHGLMHKEGNGNLDIALNTEHDILTCTITDNGIGRQQAALLNTRSAEKNKSLGVQITVDRLAILNREEKEKPVFNIEDLTDIEGNPSGTRVILKVRYRGLAEAS